MELRYIGDGNVGLRDERPRDLAAHLAGPGRSRRGNSWRAGRLRSNGSFSRWQADRSAATGSRAGGHRHLAHRRGPPSSIRRDVRPGSGRRPCLVTRRPAAGLERGAGGAGRDVGVPKGARGRVGRARRAGADASIRRGLVPGRSASSSMPLAAAGAGACGRCPLTGGQETIRPGDAELVQLRRAAAFTRRALPGFPLQRVRILRSLCAMDFPRPESGFASRRTAEDSHGGGGTDASFSTLLPMGR